jgi:hypothetical protein
MGKISFLVAMPLLVLALVPVWGSTWYVDAAVPQSANGTSWESAFKTIQQGINGASNKHAVTTWIEPTAPLLLAGTEPRLRKSWRTGRSASHILRSRCGTRVSQTGRRVHPCARGLRSIDPLVARCTSTNSFA